MRRTKFHTVTSIYAPDADISELEDLFNHAGIWSDKIWATVKGVADSSTSSSADAIDSISRDRAAAHVQLFKYTKNPTFDKDEMTITLWHDIPVCVVLEPTWLISDPHIVRDTIELNPGATIFARRYMMASDSEYFDGGIYAPIPVAVAYPLRAIGRFSSETNAAPDYAWTSQLKTPALFDILDFQLVGSDTNATIRSYEGMVPIMKDRS